MSEINARLTVKKSSQTGEVPLPSDLLEAELAVNTADGTLFTKNANDQIVQLIGSGTTVPVQTVSSVNGQIGAVALNVEDLNDIQAQTFYGLWSNELGSAPLVDGDFYPNGTTLQVAKNETNGQSKSSILASLASGNTFWISTDGITWDTRTASAATDQGIYIELTLSAAWTPDAGVLYLSEVDPSLQGKANGDVLVWNEYTNAWEIDRPENAVKSIDDLVDVDTTTSAPATNEVLQWNGSQWVPGSGAQNNSVTSVNSQTGAVVLDLEDLDNVSDQGNPYIWQFVDYVPLPGYPNLPHSWSLFDTTTLRFSPYGRNDKSAFGFSSTAGQLQGGDTFWVSESPLGPWTSLTLTTSPGDTEIPGVITFESTTAHGLTGNQEVVYVALSDPSVLQSVPAQEGGPLTWDSAIQQWTPAPPVPRTLPDLSDVVFDRNPTTDDIIRWNGLEHQWELSTAAKNRRYVLYRTQSGNNDICMLGPGLKGVGLRSSRAFDRNNAPDYLDQRPMIVYPGETIEFDLSALQFLDNNGELPGGSINVWSPAGASVNPDCYTYDTENRVLKFEVPVQQQAFGQPRFTLLVGTQTGLDADGIYAAFSLWSAAATLPTMYPRAWFRVDLDRVAVLAGIQDDSWNGEDKITVNLEPEEQDWGHGPSFTTQVFDICSDHSYHYGRASTTNIFGGGGLFYPDGLPKQITICPKQGYVKLHIESPMYYGSTYGEADAWDLNNARSCSTGHTLSSVDEKDYMYRMYQATAESMADKADPATEQDIAVDLSSLKEYQVTRLNLTDNLEFVGALQGPSFICRNTITNTLELPRHLTVTSWMQSGTYGNQTRRMNLQMGY